MTLPLEGLLVVSLEQAVAAPTCTCRMADAGARVIKIERPEGDFARGYDTLVHGESAYFVWLNRGKQSVVLDLTKDEDKTLLEAMLAQGRRVRAEPQARHRRQARLRHRAPAQGLPEADLLLDLRLRRERPVCAAQGLRPADPGRQRAVVGHRRPGGAGARRRLGGRCRDRHERLRSRAGSADRTRAHGRGRGCQRVAVRRHGRLDDGAAAAHRGRQAAATHRPRASVDLALRRVQEPRRRRYSDLDPERPRMASCWRRRSWAMPRSPPIPALPP